MDHPCSKCGYIIEDGKPFCPQCSAPQIRVAIPERAPSDLESALAQTTPLDFPAPSTPLPTSASPDSIHWSQALKPCSIAGVLSVLVICLRLIFPLIAILGAGVLAPVLYLRRNPVWRVTASSAAKLGAVTGVIISGICGIFFAITLAILQSGGELRREMLDALQQVATRSNDPQVQAALNLLKQPEGLVPKLVLGMFSFFVISVALSSLAGAVTGAFLGRRSRL